MDKVISKTKYDRKHLKKFYKFHMFHRSKLTYLIIFIMFFVLYNTIRQTIEMEDLSQITFAWALAGFTFMLIPMLMIFQINDIVRKETKERKESIEIITATKDKITRNNDKIQGKVVFGWHQIEAIRETKEYIFIYTGPKQGVYIPKESIVEGDVESFKALAEKHMKKNKKGKVNYKRIYREKVNDK